MSQYKQFLSIMFFNHLSMVLKATVLHQHFLFVEVLLSQYLGSALIWFMNMNNQASQRFFNYENKW